MADRDAAYPQDNRLTRSQRIALATLTMADAIQSMSFTPDGTCFVTIGPSCERWMITRRGRKELTDA